MGGVDHDLLGSGPFASQPCEDAVENAQPAPADKAVVECLMRAVVLGRILPLQAVADDIDDPAHHRRSSTSGTPCESENATISAPSDANSSETITHHSILPDIVNTSQSKFISPEPERADT